MAAACPEWVDQVLLVEDWSHRYADRIDNGRLPASRTKQHELAVRCATHGYNPRRRPDHPRAALTVQRWCQTGA
ncbi:hypothetical protein ACFU6I_20435 [Streptomyces sp. NPDC057486]|uniref:hypothetical protein n=1 Tax=Streptomyces sp. NPDC057486 TaxID=3346145 RepID=UPI00367A2F0E